MVNRTAVVTGAARGIGAACARRLAQDGHHVVVADIDGTAATAIAKEMQELGLLATALVVDVTDPEDVAAKVGTLAAEHGAIDIFVNNAGIAGRSGPVATYDVAEWRRVMSVDLDGVFYCCRAVVPLMTRHGWGRIINIASISGKEGNPNMAAYSTAKAGVIGFTKALAKEIAATGVLVNCVTPAVIETEILRQLDQQAIDYMLARVPMGRPGQVDEVAALVSWLASEECSFSTGAVFDLSGGRATY